MENTYKGLKPVMACPVVGLRASLENTYKGLKHPMAGTGSTGVVGLENTYKGLKLSGCSGCGSALPLFGEYL